ncbi:MAG: hypothetical protein MUF51_01830 [Vicinamibacteria bacterium]|jgi:type II secretory pathway pseudopilin PulG|nr:hypothetical protein [Vicinamibacteria bacterium]
MSEKKMTRSTEGGFSMVELTVALAITLIIGGAIVGLLTSGKNAFRNQPELSDRQQQIRMAMSMIQQDILLGGLNMASFSQVFTDGLNNLSTNPNSVIVAGEKTDDLEILSYNGSCPPLTPCKRVAGSSAHTYEMPPPCFTLPGMVSVNGPACANNGCNSTIPGTWRSQLMWACLPGKPGSGSGSNACDNQDSSYDRNGHLTFPHGQAKDVNPPGGPDVDAQTITSVALIRYQIRIDGEGVPNLWRSPKGGMSNPANTGNNKCQSDTGDNGDGWMLLARGIEDLQVEYQNGISFANGNWTTTPGVVMPVPSDSSVYVGDLAGFNTIIRRVRVTLSGRAMAANLQGQRSFAGETAAVRGRLTSITAPRGAQMALYSDEAKAVSGTNQTLWR